MRAVAVAYCIAHSKCRGSSRARNRRAHLLAPADANRAAQSAKPHDTILSLGVRLRQNSDGPVSVITRHRKEDMDVDLYCTANVTALFRVDANSVSAWGCNRGLVPRFASTAAIYCQTFRRRSASPSTSV